LVGASDDFEQLFQIFPREFLAGQGAEKRREQSADQVFADFAFFCGNGFRVHPCSSVAKILCVSASLR